MGTVSRPAASITFGFIVAGLVALVGVCGLVPVAAAQPLGSEFRVNTYTTSYQGRPRVAADSTGNFVVVWQSSGQDGSYDGVFGQRYDSSGAVQGPEFRVNTYTTSGQRFPSVAADAAGNFVVVWQDSGSFSNGRGIFGQRYSSSGAPQGPEFRVNTTTGYGKRTPAVAADAAGNFVVVWRSLGQDGSGYGVFGQRYDSGGAPQGPEFRVNTYTTGDQRSPSVAADGAGNFVVVWQSRYQDGSSDGIFGQRYSSSGAPQGPEFRVNTYTTSFQNYPAVAADSTGNFVVVWTSYQGPSGIFGQRYASSGAPQGAEFRVNTYTTCTRGFPAVAADSTGNFEVVWYSLQDDSSGCVSPGGYSVFGQRYSSAGVPQGPEFRVNSFTFNEQTFPAVAADAAGNFVVVWQSNTQDGSNYGVFGQRFTSVIPPCGNGTPDPGEDCDEGTSNGSPSSCCSASCVFIAAGTECRAAAGVCDVAETCTGSSGSCPMDVKSTAECRAAAGACDVAESCDGVSNNCPPNGFQPATVQCRASAGVCDPAENCPGNGPNCPGDAKSTAPCRAVAGVCDVAESCDGVNNDCPADAKSTAVCRPAAGDCDAADSCDGVSNDCPPDLFLPPSQVCRPPVGPCDAPETCSGISTTCPADVFLSDGTPCNDGDACTANDACAGGVCIGEPSCNDHYLCYKIKPTTDFIPLTVNLVDQFENAAAEVHKPKALCPPANKNSEGVRDPVTHEESYPIKPAVKHMSHTNVEVMDQFGTLHVDTVKADRLLVPTNKGLGSTPPPVSGTVDHYKCYKVKITKGTTAFPKTVQATVQTQFETRLYDVKKPKHLCTPVNKNGEGVTSTIAHLMCYQVRAAKGQLPHAKVIGTIRTRNQFGTGRLDTIKADELCVPAQKHL